MMGRIVVIGDVMTDTIVRPHGPLIRGSDRAATIRQHAGGSGANQAAWIAALGGSVTFLGRVGRADHAAQSELLARHGVQTMLAADADLPTGQLVTLLDPDGERSFLTDRGANDALCAADLPDSALDGAALLHVSGYSLFTPGPRAAVLHLVSSARQRGLPATFDAASAAPLAETGAAQFFDWTAGADTLFANLDEAEVLTGTADWTEQLASLAPFYRTVVLKRGAAGAVAATRTEFAEAPATQVTPLDTTGAGDAFLAGFLTARLAGATLADCLVSGVRQGSIATQRLGGRPQTS